jgi:hypothetical protein
MKHRTSSAKLVRMAMPSACPSSLPVNFER